MRPTAYGVIIRPKLVLDLSGKVGKIFGGIMGEVSSTLGYFHGWLNKDTIHRVTNFSSRTFCIDSGIGRIKTPYEVTGEFLITRIVFD